MSASQIEEGTRRPRLPVEPDAAGRRAAQWSLAFLLAVVVLGTGVRVLQPSPGGLYTHDFAFLAAWSRYVAEADHIGWTAPVIDAARSGDSEAVARALLERPGSLAYAILFGLYENPEKITRLLDVVWVAAWQRLVTTSESGLELFAVLVSVLGIPLVFALAMRMGQSRLTACVAAGVYAFLPAHIVVTKWLSWHTMGETIFVLTVLVSLRSVRRSGSANGLAGLSAAGACWGLALYSNTLLPFLVPLVVLPGFYRAFVTLPRREGTSRGAGDFVQLVRALAVYGLSGAAVFAPALAFLGAFWSKFVARNIGGYASTYAGEVSLGGKIGAMLLHWSEALTPLVLVLAFVGLVATVVGRKERAYPLVAWLASFLGFVVVFGHPKIIVRSSLAVLPCLSIVAAIGTAACWDALRRSAAVSRLGPALGAVVHAMPIVACLVGLASVPRVEDAGRVEREMTAWMRQNLPGGSLLVSDFANSLIAFSPPGLPWAVANAKTFADRYQAGGDIDGYLAWRYPAMSRPPPAVVLALTSDEGLEAGPHARAAIESALVERFGLERKRVEPAGWEGGVLSLWSRRGEDGEQGGVQ